MSIEAAEDAESLSYTSAMAELESILLQLEDDDVDIDALSSQVKRAAELIEFCRQRIQSAKVQVEQVVTNLETATSGGLDSEEED